MMLRCNIPCQLTAGPLLELNFETCGIVSFITKIEYIVLNYTEIKRKMLFQGFENSIVIFYGHSFCKSIDRYKH